MREDVSGRFDYQFETRWSRRIVHAGVVLATLATATAVTPNVSQPVPTPTQPPSTVASEPPSTMPPPPTTRAPISLSPESRAPFRTRRRPGRTTRVAGYSAEGLTDGPHNSRLPSNNTAFGARQPGDHADILPTLVDVRPRQADRGASGRSGVTRTKQQSPSRKECCAHRRDQGPVRLAHRRRSVGGAVSLPAVVGAGRRPDSGRRLRRCSTAAHKASTCSSSSVGSC